MNEKYFLPPQHDGSNLKDLLKRLASAGAGRPVDKDGFPQGSWTPELLADAITRLDANHGGIDLRTVQLWFQDNDRGISTENIRWLARIFGCDDPEATSQWQMELAAAQSSLAATRRKQKRTGGRAPKSPLAQAETVTYDSKFGTEVDNDTTGQVPHPSMPNKSETLHSLRYPPKRNRTGLAEKCEWLLSGEMAVNLVIAYWLVLCALGLMNYAMGTLSVTYSPQDGLEKQVGFIWAPTLTVLPLVVLPLFILSVSDLISFWKNDARSRCSTPDAGSDKLMDRDGWMLKVKSFSVSFWAIVLFCYLFVFAFQWAGIYLPAYSAGDPGGVQIDRYLVTLLRPDVISTQEAMILSAVGYHYTASYIAVFMLGLLFLIIVVLDYQDVCKNSKPHSGGKTDSNDREMRCRILWGGFRIAVHGLWLATLIKLQITYLSSDAKDFLTWLSTDARSALGFGTSQNGWLENNSVSHFTTFLMMVVVVAVFGLCVSKICLPSWASPQLGVQVQSATDSYALVKMGFVIFLLSVNLLLVGQFVGFSLLVVLSVAASVYILCSPKLKQQQVN